MPNWPIFLSKVFFTTTESFQVKKSISPIMWFSRLQKMVTRKLSNQVVETQLLRLNSSSKLGKLLITPFLPRVEKSSPLERRNVIEKCASRRPPNNPLCAPSSNSLKSRWRDCIVLAERDLFGVCQHTTARFERILAFVRKAFCC
jgi:hypothetical protein